jgi:amino acid transporter
MSTAFDAFKAVFWSFLGVRKRAAYESDTQNLKPHHVIAAGLLAALVFVLLLYGLVQYLTR